MGAMLLLGVVVVGYLLVLGLSGWKRLALGLLVLAFLPRLPREWWQYGVAALGLLALPQLLSGSLTVVRWALRQRAARRQRIADERRRRLEPLPAPIEPAVDPGPVRADKSASPWVGS